MAIISATFIWSYEVGAKLSSSLYQLIFEVDDAHMDNYPHVLEAKIPIIILVMFLTVIVPSNDSIQKKAAILRQLHKNESLKARGMSKYLKLEQNRSDQDRQPLMGNESPSAGDLQEGGEREDNEGGNQLIFTQEEFLEMF